MWDLRSFGNLMQLDTIYLGWQQSAVSAQWWDILCVYMYSQRSCSHPVASFVQCYSATVMKNYSEWIVIHLSGTYTGDTENKSWFFSKNPAYQYTHRNCSFTPKSLTWISAKFRVILFKRASCMIMKTNDHDKNPEKVRVT